MNDLPQAPQLDAEVLQAQARIRERGVANGDMLRDPPAKARADTGRYQAFLNEGGPAADITEHVLPTTPEVRVRLYRPRGQDGVLPVYLHIHGGGFAFGSLDTADRLKRELAEEAGVVVAGLDYALAPEHPFPTALEQVLAVLRWLHTEAALLRIDPLRIGIGGDSAGGNLALSSLLRLRDEGGPVIGFGAIVYGMLSTAHQTPSHLQLGDGRFGLSTAKLDWFWDAYLAGTGRDDAAVRPLDAPLEGLPPLLLIAAALDPLLDDTLALDRRLTNAGVAHEMVIYDGMPHGFLGQTALLEKARNARSRIAASLRRFLG
ncbi:alpha/beta hydrolase [Roseomonas haemaphysalidis]|uniref:Alpha/beta hydrolase n=1 Tax=Roseomonas haemaphysalidis TaxID=2768162 RepID=A0ABS3KM96_9PROT|nr:alpha/beta hydrolase [Roseomonas haemaphysalidis]MBO1078570.1 alpha/beta hydrolase [Roseomonas haemaphysalidis]